MGSKLRLFVVMVLFYTVLAKDPADGREPEEVKPTKINNGAPLLFADELKQTLERYLFGMCPQNYKYLSQPLSSKPRNATSSCDLDLEQQDLAGRLAALALHAHSAGRAECSRLGVALANTFGELARTAAHRHSLNTATNEAKKRKLSKSQKAKLQAKQRTALAVKKKAAALAAAAAAKISVSA